ncbi:MAG: hypothetical protein ACOCQD_05050 [archaeon]
MSVSKLLGHPDFVEGVGNIYPVKLKDYDKFNANSDILYISKNNFEEVDLPLLFLILKGLESSGVSKDIVVQKMITILQIVLRKEDIQYFEQNSVMGFIIDEKNCIHYDNYDKVREIIMNQNLLFEPKVFKNKMVQEWAEKVLLAKTKNSANITFEDMIDTIHIYTGMPYSELEEETIYQIRRDFDRVCKIKKYETEVLYQTVDEKHRDVEHFAEQIVFKNPYDDLFVKKDKLNKLDNAMK